MLKIQHPYTTDEVVKALQKANPSKKQTESASIKKWQQYQQLITQAVQRSIIMARKDQIEQNQLPINWHQINQELGECRKFGDYLTWFQQHFPLVRILRRGFPGTLTMTELLYDVELGSTSQTPREAFDTMYNKYTAELEKLRTDPDSELIDWVPINQLSLRAFIKGNLDAQSQPSHTEHLSTLRQNYVWAKTILLCAEYMEQQGWGSLIPQIANESDFGRRYYSGLNLQNCPKLVRTAALGNCYQYDLNASVYAWRYNFVRAINSKIKMPYTLEYIDEKDQRRQQLAEKLDIPIKSLKNKINIIKTLITAIGFGSRPGNNGVSWQDQSGKYHYPAINQIIKSPKAREKLLSDPWLKGFIEEQKMISKTIFDAIKELLRDREFLINQRGNLSVNACLAYAYQTEERACIDQLTQRARQDGTFLLAVHDGFYTSRPVKLVELKEQLYQFNPYATISKEQHLAWGYNDHEQQHRELINELEKKANGGVIPRDIKENYLRIQHMNSDTNEYHASDEYHAGQYQHTEYDQDFDPFFMED